MSAAHFLKYFVLACAGSIVLYLISCSGSSPKQQDGWQSRYPPGQLPQLSFIETYGRNLHYAKLPGTDGGTPLLFIHGSPGDWQAWHTYLNHPSLKNFGPRIAIDRPGFGNSTTGGIVTDLRQQAKMLDQFVSSSHPSIVVGHSLGAPIAAWLAIEYPNSVCGVVSIAGSLAPDLEQLRWYNHVASWRLIQLLLPQSLIDSNNEMKFLQKELSLLDRAWPQMRRPFFVVQGMQDELVNPKTLEYLESNVDDALLAIKRHQEQGHFIVWEAPELVVEAINEVNDDYCQNPIL